ncbi:ABC transporter ATP-binding protein [Candidatus Margulisiibacteriota bacterium]
MIKLENIGFSVKNKQILNNIELQIKKGETLVIAGENGAGKSTLLRIMAGFQPPSSGQVLLDEKNLTEIEPNERVKSIVWQAPTLLTEFRFKVIDVIGSGRFPYVRGLGILGKKDKLAVAETMKDMELEEFSELLFSEISTGEQQRTLLAKSLVQEPRFLLLDEPFGHLDVRHRQMCVKMLKNKAQKQGLGLVIVTHDLNTGVNLADRIMLMKQGKIFALGNTQEIIKSKILSEAFQADFTVSYSDSRWHIDY